MTNLDWDSISAVDLLALFKEAKISKEPNCIDDKFVIINLSLATSL